MASSTRLADCSFLLTTHLLMVKRLLMERRPRKAKVMRPLTVKVTPLMKAKVMRSLTVTRSRFRATLKLRRVGVRSAWPSCVRTEPQRRQTGFRVAVNQNGINVRGVFCYRCNSMWRIQVNNTAEIRSVSSSGGAETGQKTVLRKH